MSGLLGAALIAAGPVEAIQAPSFYISFKSGSAVVPPEAAQDIQAAAAYVLDMSDERCRISLGVSGYTDAQGSRENNLALAQRRATAVRDALIEAGVPANQVTTFAFGERQLGVTTADGVAEPLNRRVTIESGGCHVEPMKRGD